MLALTADFADFAGLLKLCQKLPPNYKWALITHDLDETTDHYHVAIQAPTPTTPSAIAKRLNTAPNYVQIWRGNTNNLWAYLAHNTNTAKDEKADYNHYLTDPTKFATNLPDLKPFEYSTQKQSGSKNTKLNEMIKQVLDGNLTLKELLHPDNIHYYHDNYLKLNRAIQLRTQSLRYNPPENRTIYIQGASGSGKTNYATKLAEKHYPKHWIFGSSGNDPLQDYTGEKCLILDDWRPKDYELNDFLALTDPHYRQRTHKSRYFNKPLATELIIITSNTTLDEAIHYYTDFNSEDPKQIRRRIYALVTVHDPDNKTIELYNEQIDAWELTDKPG